MIEKSAIKDKVSAAHHAVSGRVVLVFEQLIQGVFGALTKIEERAAYQLPLFCIDEMMEIFCYPLLFAQHHQCIECIGNDALRRGGFNQLDEGDWFSQPEAQLS